MIYAMNMENTAEASTTSHAEISFARAVADRIVEYGYERELLQQRLETRRLRDAIETDLPDGFDFKSGLGAHAGDLGLALSDVDDRSPVEEAALLRFGSAYGALMSEGPGDACWPALRPGVYRDEFHFAYDGRLEATEGMLREFVDASDALVVICARRLAAAAESVEAVADLLCEAVAVGEALGGAAAIR